MVQMLRDSYTYVLMTLESGLQIWYFVPKLKFESLIFCCIFLYSGDAPIAYGRLRFYSHSTIECMVNVPTQSRPSQAPVLLCAYMCMNHDSLVYITLNLWLVVLLIFFLPYILFYWCQIGEKTLRRKFFMSIFCI